MNETHTGFIFAAYAATAVIIGAMIVAVVADYGAQLRALARLERSAHDE